MVENARNGTAVVGERRDPDTFWQVPEREQLPTAQEVLDGKPMPFSVFRVGLKATTGEMQGTLAYQASVVVDTKGMLVAEDATAATPTQAYLNAGINALKEAYPKVGQGISAVLDEDGKHVTFEDFFGKKWVSEVDDAPNPERDKERGYSAHSHEPLGRAVMEGLAARMLLTEAR